MSLCSCQNAISKEKCHCFSVWTLAKNVFDLISKRNQLISLYFLSCLGCTFSTNTSFFFKLIRCLSFLMWKLKKMFYFSLHATVFLDPIQVSRYSREHRRSTFFTTFSTITNQSIQTTCFVVFAFRRLFCNKKWTTTVSAAAFTFWTFVRNCANLLATANVPVAATLVSRTKPSWRYFGKPFFESWPNPATISLYFFDL